MATRVISTSIKLDGEQEFNKQMKSIDSELKTIKSDMALATAEFKGQANSVEALTARGDLLRKQYDQQAEKVKALEKAVSDSTEAFGDADRRTDDYKRQLNYAKIALGNLDDELQKNDQYMEEAKRSTDNCADSIDEFGREIKDAGKQARDAGDDFKSPIGAMDDFMGKLGGLKGMLAGGAVVGGAKALVDGIMGVVDSTEEYRKIMGTLETSSQAAGYSAEEMKESYMALYAVLGDNQAAATTVANLQAIGMSQEDLMTMTEYVIGAWAKYGDSIPIDGLSEAINETIKCGQVTGVFADVLNWGATEGETFGVKLRESNEANKEWNEAVMDCKTAEDYFNLALSDCETQADRTNLMMQTMSEQGLEELAQSWHENNGEIEDMNTAQAELEEAMGRMGELLSPLAAKLVSFGADALEFVIGKVKSAIDWFKKLNDDLNKSGQARIDAGKAAQAAREDGSHALGLERVPFDNYRAVLHQGEGVLTATENRALETLRISGLPAAQPARQEAAMTAADMNSIISAMAPAGGQQDLVLNITMEMDGDILARKQLRYNARQKLLAGESMIDGGM